MTTSTASNGQTTYPMNDRQAWVIRKTIEEGFRTNPMLSKIEEPRRSEMCEEAVRITIQERWKAARS